MTHSILKLALGALVGASLGYGYYRLVGCSTGSCPLTSNPVITTLYGAFMGIIATLG